MSTKLVRTVGLAATCVGTSHEERGASCEDAARWHEGPVSMIALADGAGSARHAALGAAIAVEAAIALVSCDLDGLVASGPERARERILRAVDAALAHAAAEVAATPRELASTLLFAAVGRDRFLAGHLGDGAVGARLSGRTVLLSDGCGAEHANETALVPTRHDASEMRLFTGPAHELGGFVLLSDGAASALVGSPQGRPAARELSPIVDRWWDGLERHRPELVESAVDASLRSTLRRATRDDCGIALLRRVEAGSLRESEQLGWLGATSARSSKVRARVARAWRSLGPRASTSRIARCLHLGVHTVRKHLEALERIGWALAP